MDDNAVHLEIGRPWRAEESLILLGPGGVGKSTLGAALAKRLGWHLIDLDQLFCFAIGMIGTVIAEKGYEHYRAENLALAERCMEGLDQPVVLVSSSGFLAGPEGSDDLRRARLLVRRFYGLTLLPSLDLEEATDIVVARQVGRGFGFEKAAEDVKFRQRLQIYRQAGDALVVSVADPAIIAQKVVAALDLRSKPAR